MRTCFKQMLAQTRAEDVTWIFAGLGRKGVYLYNLPEVASAYKYLRVPGVSARFGTDPFIWNWAMWLVARLCPPGFLKVSRGWGLTNLGMLLSCFIICHSKRCHRPHTYRFECSMHVPM